MPAAVYPEQFAWDQAADDWWWLDRFQMDPERVDQLRPGTYARLKEIDGMAAQIRKEAQERANRG